MLAILVTGMGSKELKDALISKVTRIESLFVYAMDDRIGKKRADTLNVYNDQIASCDLPGEVADCLG